MTWDKLIGSEISLSTRHIHTVVLLLVIGFGTNHFISIVLSHAGKGVLEGCSSLRSSYSTLCVFTVCRSSLFGVHLYGNITLPFLKCEQPNPAATQAKAQVLSLLLSH